MTLSDTLATGLAEYRIGPKIRALRLKKGLGQAQLGEHTGLSSALLSKIERGQLFPTLPTLLRIAMVFGVGLDFFFRHEHDEHLLVVTRGKDRMRLPNVPGASAPAFYFESLDFPAPDRKMDAYYAQFPASSDASEPHSHSGTELIYVISGKLQVRFAAREVILGPGDAMHFDSIAPHSYHGCEPNGAAAIVVALRTG